MTTLTSQSQALVQEVQDTQEALKAMREALKAIKGTLKGVQEYLDKEEAEFTQIEELLEE